MNAQTFIDALHAVEDRGDVEPMAALHADDAELRNPSHRAPPHGPEGRPTTEETREWNCW